MEEVEISLKDDYIKLGQALKASGAAGSGVEAKYMIQDGEVFLNGKTELQRGKKLVEGDEIECGNLKIKIISGR